MAGFQCYLTKIPYCVDPEDCCPSPVVEQIYEDADNRQYRVVSIDDPRVNVASNTFKADNHCGDQTIPCCWSPVADLATYLTNEGLSAV